MISHRFTKLSNKHGELPSLFARSRLKLPLVNPWGQWSWQHLKLRKGGGWQGEMSFDQVLKTGFWDILWFPKHPKKYPRVENLWPFFYETHLKKNLSGGGHLLVGVGHVCPTQKTLGCLSGICRGGTGAFEAFGGTDGWSISWGHVAMITYADLRQNDDHMVVVLLLFFWLSWTVDESTMSTWQ